MTIIIRLNDGIKEAMRSQDALRLSTLRMLKSKILAVDARGTLPDADVTKLIKTYLGSVQEELEQAHAINRIESAEKLKQEVAIILEFLPKALSTEETKKVVEQAIKESGALSKRDLGSVMKAVRAINPDVDGKMAKEIADQLLE